MYKELRFDKQILVELFDAKFLCASFHVKFINCCRDMTPGEWSAMAVIAQLLAVCYKICNRVESSLVVVVVVCCCCCS